MAERSPGRTNASLFQRAQRVIPGGVNSPVRAFRSVGGTPYLVAELFWPSEDVFKAWAATPESAEVRKHAKGCGTTFTTYSGDVTEV